MFTFGKNITLMVTIYALIDPRNDSPFYIGSTNCLLENRLSSHLMESRLNITDNSRDHTKLKRQRIRNIIKDGYKLLIIPLLVCPDSAAVKAERYIYKLVQSNGYRLHQSPSINR